MRSVIGVVHGELRHRGEVALDSIQPRGPGRRPIEEDAMRPGTGQDLCGFMKRCIVENHVQGQPRRILRPHPDEERQEFLRVLTFPKAAAQGVGLQIVQAEEVRRVGREIKCMRLD